MSLNRIRSHGLQVRLATAGTNFDINRPDRPSTGLSPQALAGHGSNQRFLNTAQETVSSQGVTILDPVASKPTTVLLGQTVSVFGTSVNRGLFPEGFVSSDALSVNAATIEKGRTKSVSFSNPTKVTKTRLDKESRYGTARRSMRVSGTQESGTVVSEDEDATVLPEDDADIEEIADEEMTEAPTNRVLPRKRKHPRYTDEYETPEKAEAALRRLMNNHIDMRLGDLFSLPGVSLAQILNRRRPFVPRTGGDDYQVRDETTEVRRLQNVQDVQEVDSLSDAAAALGLYTYVTPEQSQQVEVMSLHAVAPDTSNVPSPAMHTPKMEVIIHDKMRVRATLDSGAEVNVMSKKLADKCNLAIETKKNLVFQGISPGKVFFLGACRRVKVVVGGSVNFVDFLVIDSGTADLLLGMPYFIETELTFLYEPEGAVRAKLRSGNRKRTVTVTVAGDPILVEGDESEN